MPSLEWRLCKYLSAHRVKVDALLENISKEGGKVSIARFCVELGKAELGLSARRFSCLPLVCSRCSIRTHLRIVARIGVAGS